MELQKIEDAIIVASKYFSAGGPYKKPTLLHSIRVGLFLLKKGYKLEICIGGILHDTLEDTAISGDEIRNTFGEEVLSNVKANTKGFDVPKEEVNSELIFRCANTSQDALIIKSADVIDNYEYYTNLSDEKGISRCIKLAKLILEAKKENFTDPIFILVSGIVNGSYVGKYFE